MAQTFDSRHDPESGAANCPWPDLSVLGKKWTYHLLRNMEVRHIDRFNQMLKSLPGLTPRVLVMRLKEFEKSGLARPIVIKESPRLVRWELTEKGKDTIPIAEGYENFANKLYPGSSLQRHIKPTKKPDIPFLLSR